MHAEQTVIAPVLPYRCGYVCTRAIAPLAAGTCACPNGMGNPHRIAIEDARKRGGPCGPEALHMAFKGVRQ